MRLMFARVKMLSKHLRNDLVVNASADCGGVFGAAEDRVRAEQWPGDEPGHGSSGSIQTINNKAGFTVLAISHK